jgi:hypothetical protein
MAERYADLYEHLLAPSHILEANPRLNRGSIIPTKTKSTFLGPGVANSSYCESPQAISKIAGE